MIHLKGTPMNVFKYYKTITWVLLTTFIYIPCLVFSNDINKLYLGIVLLLIIIYFCIGILKDGPSKTNCI